MHPGQFVRVACVGILVTGKITAQPTQYALAEIVPPNPAAASDAKYINDAGEVAGSISAGGSRRAIYWTALTGTVSLGLLPDTTSSSAGVVATDGSVFGYSASDFPPYNASTFRWTASQGMQSLGIPGSRVDDIASDGLFVGAYGNLAPNGRARALSWSPTAGQTNLPDLPGDYESWAHGVNDAHLVVGVGRAQGASQWHPLSWHDGVAEALPLLPGDASGDASDVNNNGMIVGSSNSATGSRAIRWTDPSQIELLGQPPPMYPYSGALRTNDQDETVGFFRDGGNTYHAAYWDSEGSLFSLESLLEPPASGWTLSIAWGINDVGQIVGSGVNPAGRQRGFVLTPVPEPSAIVLVAVSIAVFARHRQASRSRAFNLERRVKAHPLHCGLTGKDKICYRS